MSYEVRWAKNGEVSLAYAVSGEGPIDLMFVNIWYSNLDHLGGVHFLDKWSEGMAAFSRMIVWDRRGAGLSDRLSGPATLEEGIDDLLTVMDAAEVEKAALLGFNESSTLCMLAAATHPDRFSHLVLYGAFPTTVYKPDYPWGQDEQERDEQIAWIMANWGTREIAQMLMLDGDEESMEWAMRWMRNSVSRDALPAFYDMIAKTDVRQVLPSIRVPTLVLHRKEDLAVPVDNARYLAEHIPGAKLVELEGFHHAPFLGDRQALNDEIEEFLTGARPQREADRVLATILFTDIVDSTSTAGSVGDSRWKELLDQHDEISRGEIVKHNGRLVKSTGDGLLATFDGPQRAIRCAKAISASMPRIGLSIRAGLHTGEVEMRGDDLGGIAVHIGARVMAIAEPGEVLVSGSVPPLVAGSGIAFTARGTHALKGVEGEWPVFAVT